MIMQEKDISLVSGSTVVGYVQEKKQVGRTVRADVYVSPNYIAETAAEDYRIREYEIIRGAGGDMVCLHIEPLGEVTSTHSPLAIFISCASSLLISIHFLGAVK